MSEFLPAGLDLQTGADHVAVATGKADTAALLPRSAAAVRLASRLVGPAHADRLRFEAISILPRPSSYGTGPGAQAELAALAGILGSVSSMEGLEYWSASRKAWRTLYAESWLVDDPSRRTRLPDPSALPPGSLPETWSRFAYQRDLTFGANIYRLDFESSENAIMMTSANVTPMKTLLVTAVPPGNLQAAILVLPARDGILVYGLTTIKAFEPLKRRVFDSVGNRALSLLWWFSKRAEGEGLAIAPESRPKASF